MVVFPLRGLSPHVANAMKEEAKVWGDTIPTPFEYRYAYMSVLNRYNHVCPHPLLKQQFRFEQCSMCLMWIRWDPKELA